jgi:hypothetical protein
MKPQIARTIHRFGEPVDVIYKSGSPTRTVSASVQRPFSDALINDFDTFGYVIYIAYDDLADAPAKFDRVRLRGELRSVEEVNVEQAKGENICWILSVRG